jgi:hypothetical protein
MSVSGHGYNKLGHQNTELARQNLSHSISQVVGKPFPYRIREGCPSGAIGSERQYYIQRVLRHVQLRERSAMRIESHYSCRNAFMGSSCAARRAGRYVANIATRRMQMGTMK